MLVLVSVVASTVAIAGATLREQARVKSQRAASAAFVEEVRACRRSTPVMLSWDECAARLKTRRWDATEGRPPAP
jgi:hypothetical protein